MLALKSFPLSLLLACVALCTEGSAQCELQNIVLPEPSPSDGTGWRIAQDGETFAVAGERSVYVYRQEGLTAFPVQKLPQPVDVSSGEGIIALALDGDTLAVAFARSYPDVSTVRIYERRAGTWIEEIQFRSGRDEYFLGRQLALDGERLVVAAHEQNAAQTLPGILYVYERVAGVWTRVDRLMPPDPELDGAGFAESLDLEDDRLAVGVGRPFFVPAIAYVYERTAAGWERHDIHPASPNPEYFGHGLDLHGDMLVIGGAALAGETSRVFEHDGLTWRETGKIVSPDGMLVGSAAIVGEDLILIGDPLNSERGKMSGALRVFERFAGTWQETEKLFPSSSAPYQTFGLTVTCDGDLAVLGSLYGNSVRTFSVSGARCRTLSGSPAKISLASGGRQTLRLGPGREYAGMRYCLLGSATGFSPGFRFGGARIPLVPDAYFARSVPGQRRPPFVDNVGVLGTRRATVTIDVPPLTDIALAGLTLYHAFVVLDHGVVKHVSNVKTLTLVP